MLDLSGSKPLVGDDQDGLRANIPAHVGMVCTSHAGSTLWYLGAEEKWSRPMFSRDLVIVGGMLEESQPDSL